MDAIVLEKDVAELAVRLTKDHPTIVRQVCPELEQRESFVKKGHEEAFGCGISGKENVYLFVEARLVFGEGFHQDSDMRPALKNCLCDELRGENEKASLLSEELALHAAFS